PTIDTLSLHDALPIYPTVIVEVLSGRTEDYDRGAKFAHYQILPSFAEYVLVSQREQRVEHYRRIEPKQWLLNVFEGDATVPLPRSEEHTSELQSPDHL